MVCTSLGSLLCPLFYFLCYIHFSLSVLEEMKCVRATEAAISQTHLARARERLGRKKRIDITRIVKEVSEAGGRGGGTAKIADGGDGSVRQSLSGWLYNLSAL